MKLDVTTIVATYGDTQWRMLATTAIQSAVSQGHRTVVAHHRMKPPLSEARNEAARSAEYGWLCFLDADDTLAPGYLDAMAASVDKNPGVVLHVPAVSFDRARPRFPNGGGSRPLIDINWAVIGTLVHRSLFLNVGGFRAEDEPYEDWALWLRCVIAGAGMEQVPDAVYRATLHKESAHRTTNAAKRAQLTALYHRIRADLGDDYWKAIQ